MENSPGTLSIDTVDDVMLVRLSGEIDQFAVPTLRRRIDEMQVDGASRLVVDLAAVEFLDSSGAGLLLHLAGRLKVSHNRMIVLSTSPYVKKIVRMATGSQLFELVATREEAERLLGIPLPD